MTVTVLCSAGIKGWSYLGYYRMGSTGIGQERSQILKCCLHAVSSLFDSLFPPLSSLPSYFPEFSILCLSILPPHSPAPEHLAPSAALSPHVQMFQAQVYPRLCTGPAATLILARVGTGFSEEL